MRWIKSLVLVITLLIVFVLAALSSNQTEIALSFAIWRTPFEVSVFWWLLIVFVIGLMFGLLNGAWLGIKHRLENRKLRRELAQSNAELERLRVTSQQG